MPLSLSCDCGRRLKLKDELAGRKIRCPGCDDVLLVPRNISVGTDAETKRSVREGPPPRPRRRDEDDEDDTIDDRDTASQRRSQRREAPPPPPPRQRRRQPDSVDEEKPKKKKRKRPRDDDEGGGGGGIAINPEILSGLGMMIGAVVWFVLGLQAGYIYFYPPVLFVLGIAAIVRGFMGGA